MPETNSKGQREMFIELYRVYQRYHYEKNWLVWVAATAYLGFVGIAVRWLGDGDKPQYRGGVHFLAHRLSLQLF